MAHDNQTPQKQNDEALTIEAEETRRELIENLETMSVDQIEDLIDALPAASHRAYQREIFTNKPPTLQLARIWLETNAKKLEETPTARQMRKLAHGLQWLVRAHGINIYLPYEGKWAKTTIAYHKNVSTTTGLQFRFRLADSSQKGITAPTIIPTHLFLAKETPSAPCPD